jgi:hypothetical protein
MMLEIKIDFLPKRISQVRKTQCFSLLYRISGIKGLKDTERENIGCVHLVQDKIT